MYREVGGLDGTVSRVLANRPLVLCLIAALVCGAMLWHIAQPLVPDVSFFIMYARRVIGGAHPYVDVFETNPPLALWVTLPPVWFARQFNVSDHIVFVAFISGLIVGSLWLGWKMSRAGGGGTWLATVVVVTLALVQTVLPQAAFGQREHMFVILIAPYVVLAALRSVGDGPGKGLAAAAGVLGGIAVCFKPHFLALPLAVELALMMLRGSWRSVLRIEVGAAAVPVMLFPALVFWFAPDFLSEILPMVIQTYPDFAPAGPLVTVKKAVSVAALTALGTATLVWLMAARRQPQAIVWISAAAGAYVAYFAQLKAFPYQGYPALALSAVALAVAVAGSARRHWLLLVWLPVVMVAVVFAGKMVADAKHTRQDLDALLAGTHPASLLAITTDLGVLFPYVEDHDIKWASRFHEMWMMPAVDVGGLGSAESRRITAWTALRIAEDLVHDRPQYVIVDRTPVRYPNNRAVPFLALFGSDPDFAEAWSHYHMVNSFNTMDLWQRDN